MNTRVTPAENNILVAESYYAKMIEKDFASMGACLHPTVDFLSPLTTLSGKKDVVEAAEGLAQVLEGIEIRSKVSNAHQVMLAYDFKFPEPIGLLRAAVLMEFKEQLIAKIELFFDSAPFTKK